MADSAQLRPQKRMPKPEGGARCGRVGLLLSRTHGAAVHSSRPSIEATDELPPDAALLIDSAVWGTSGVQYETLDGSRHSRDLPGQRYFVLRIEGVVRGIYAVARHTLESAGVQRPAGYRNTLVVDPSVSGRGFGYQLMRAAYDELGADRLLYGYIETENHRSARIAQRMGYTPHWRLRATVWGRRRPRDDERVVELSHEAFAPMARAFTEDQVRPEIDVLLSGSRVYGLVANGEVRAALAAIPCTWRIRSLGSGLAGRALMWAVPRLRLFGSTLVDGAYPHVRVSTVVVTDGAEKDAAHLLEAVIARHRVHVALWLVDPRDPAYQRLRAAGVFGWLDAIAGGDEAVVYAGGALPPNVGSTWADRPLAVPVAFPG